MRLTGMRATLLAAPLLCLAVAPASVAAQSARDSALHAQAPDSITRSAERAAREWLWLLDEQLYDRAWTLVAPAMQSIVGYQQWTTSLTQLRAVLPFPLRRRLLRAEPSVPLFGGNSLILSFGVGQGSLREIVVLVRSDNRWQVGGYGILLY